MVGWTSALSSPFGCWPPRGVRCRSVGLDRSRSITQRWSPLCLPKRASKTFCPSGPSFPLTRCPDHPVRPVPPSCRPRLCFPSVASRLAQQTVPFPLDPLCCAKWTKCLSRIRKPRGENPHRATRASAVLLHRQLSPNQLKWL